MAAAALALGFVRAAHGQLPPSPPGATTAPGASPAPPPALPAEAAPLAAGVWIEWAAGRVLLSGRVLRRDSVLEFAASFAGKHHESLVALDATARDVFSGLGLAGLDAGHPPRWDEQARRFTPAAGDLLDVRFVWRQGEREHSASPFEWMTELQYARPPRARPWVFAGSQRRGDGRLAADITGSGFALVDFPDSLVCLSISRSSANDELWLDANLGVMPPAGTPVLVVVQKAAPVEHAIELDFRGVARVDGRVEPDDDVADLVALLHRLSPGRTAPILLNGTLRSDEQRWERTLGAAGVPPTAWRFERRDDPRWLRSAVESPR
jgi:hypothetical protein